MVQGFAQILQTDTNNANDYASVSFNALADTDTDGDGMPNGYEISNGFNPNNPNDALQDADGDGLTNLQEFHAGTDPHNGASVLKISSFTRPTFGFVTITFLSVSGRTYRIESCNSIGVGPWIPVQSNIQGTGGLIQVTDYGSLSYVEQFYRVVVVP